MPRTAAEHARLLARRDAALLAAWRAGADVPALAWRFDLSEDTIRDSLRRSGQKVASNHGGAGSPRATPTLGDPAAAQRCRGCGQKIYVWPCLGCLIRSKNAQPEASARDDRLRARSVSEGIRN